MDVTLGKPQQHTCCRTPGPRALEAAQLFSFWLLLLLLSVQSVADDGTRCPQTQNERRGERFKMTCACRPLLIIVFVF